MNQSTYPIELQSSAKWGFWISANDIFDGTEKEKKIFLEYVINNAKLK